MRRQAAAVVALCAVVCVDGFSLLRVPAASRDRVRQACPRWLAQAERDQLQGAQEGPEPIAAVPPQKPKKPLSGFLLFSREMRPKVRADDPGISFADMSKRLGELWRGLSDAEKARYSRK